MYTSTTWITGCKVAAPLPLARSPVRTELRSVPDLAVQLLDEDPAVLVLLLVGSDLFSSPSESPSSSFLASWTGRSSYKPDLTPPERGSGPVANSAERL